jgi:hypothetical protein
MSDDDLGPLNWAPSVSAATIQAKRQEFRIALHVGDQIKHIAGRMPHAAIG